MKNLDKECPLCGVRHTVKKQIECYIELQSRIEGGVATAEEKRVFVPMSMNEYKL